ncbi:hypothetical protein NP569_27225, partial [Vibrio parahaemolyticus]|nr:hypothetical protein [Vibrio parahaemolyticus]
ANLTEVVEDLATKSKSIGESDVRGDIVSLRRELRNIIDAGNQSVRAYLGMGTSGKSQQKSGSLSEAHYCE